MTKRLSPFAILLAALFWHHPAPAADGRLLAIESGEVIGMYYPEAGAICRMINRDRGQHGLRCVVEPTAGSMANLAALRHGDGQLAIVQSRILAQAVTGTGAFAREPFPDLRSLMSLHGESVLVLVNPAARIRTPADLKGKRVTLGHTGSFQRQMADMLLSAAGLSTADLASALEMDNHMVPEALCRNEVDAAIFTGLHPIAEAQEAIDDCGAGLLSLKDGGVDSFLKANPAFSRQVVAEDTYAGVHDKTSTFGVNAILVATAALSADDAYTVVKAVFEGLDAFKGMHPLLAGLDRRRMARDGVVPPLHDGAQRYFKEKGLP